MEALCRNAMQDRPIMPLTHLTLTIDPRDFSLTSQIIEQVTHPRQEMDYQLQVGQHTELMDTKRHMGVEASHRMQAG